MSANNWRVCPACKSLAEREVMALDQEVAVLAAQDAPVSQFFPVQDRLLAAQKELKSVLGLETFREDYEFWFDGEGLRWHYTGRCDRCGFGHAMSEENSEPTWEGGGGKSNAR